MSVSEQQVAELLSLMPGGVLIFDTSFDDGCLIWVKPSGEVISTIFDSSTRASEGLVETLETWMTTKDLQTLTGLALGLGPGSFTGVRVAAATAKGLAAAGDIQIFGLSSLRWLEKSHHVSRRVAVVIDARQDEVYMRLAGETEDRVLSVEDCAHVLKKNSVEVLISNWLPEVVQERLGFWGEVLPLHLAVDEGIGLALETIRQEAPLGAHEISPTYLKLTPAERNLTS